VVLHIAVLITIWLLLWGSWGSWGCMQLHAGCTTAQAPVLTVPVVSSKSVLQNICCDKLILCCCYKLEQVRLCPDALLHYFAPRVVEQGSVSYLTRGSRFCIFKSAISNSDSPFMLDNLSTAVAR
jgi:hypothetical protein